MKFIVLIKQMNNIDEINKFLMNNYQSKIWDIPEAHEKSLSETEELKRFQGSTFDTENWSKIETPSLNSQARFRNYKMKLIV